MGGADLRLELSATLRGAPEVRKALVPWLREHHIRKDVESEVTLVCTELFVNAVEAAGPDGSVTVKVVHEPGQIAVEVEDDGPGFVEKPDFRMPDPGASRGRGLALVEMIAGPIVIKRRKGRTVIRCARPID
jgi:anti-sigma regulatory factor (Ser/Thr protein kinase)